MAQNSNVPRSQEDYINRVFEEIEGEVTRKLSQEFSRTKNRILVVLSRLNNFFMNPLNQGHSRTALETSRSSYGTNQRMKEEDSQNDPQPGAGVFHNQSTRYSGPEKGHNMVIGVHEEFTHCCASKSSVKQKKNHSSSQPQSRSENITATIEADQFFWPLVGKATINLQTFITKSTEFPNCQNRSLQRCPRSTASL